MDKIQKENDRKLVKTKKYFKEHWNKINIMENGNIKTEIEETDIIKEVRGAINKLKIGNSQEKKNITPEINLLHKRMERMNYITQFIRREM